MGRHSFTHRLAAGLGLAVVVCALSWSGVQGQQAEPARLPALPAKPLPRWRPASPGAGKAVIAATASSKTEPVIVPVSSEEAASSWGPPGSTPAEPVAGGPELWPEVEPITAMPAEVEAAPAPLPFDTMTPAASLLAPRLPPPEERFPIDLPTALRLAGANNLQIALAQERIQQAQARLQAANVLWIPSLQAGVGYNRHDGTIQDTRGDVFEISRSSVYAGGGPNVGGNPLNGGTNGPARFFVGLPFTDALFEPLVRRQDTEAANAVHAATFNDTLLQVTSAYLDLVRAYGDHAIAVEAVTNAQELVRLIDSRVRAGTTPPADGYRAQAELADRQRQQFEAQEVLHVTSAELVRLLRLDQSLVLYPLDEQPVPIDVVDQELPLPELIVQGLSSRPEMAAYQAQVNAARTRLRQEKWRPCLPNLQVGYSGGAFGGGRNAFLGNFDGRSDLDALLVWDLRNLGFGNRALQRERLSQNLQAGLAFEQLSDLVAAEVARSYYQVRFRNRQLDYTRLQVRAAAEALPLNFKGIRGGQLRAIEAQQAIQALVLARKQYLASLTDYNRAQFALLRALGQPADASFQERP
ncbi:MAG: TolC family protein [Gemmataceae bacterium]